MSGIPQMERIRKLVVKLLDEIDALSDWLDEEDSSSSSGDSDYQSDKEYNSDTIHPPSGEISPLDQPKLVRQDGVMITRAFTNLDLSGMVTESNK